MRSARCCCSITALPFLPLPLLQDCSCCKLTRASIVLEPSFISASLVYSNVSTTSCTSGLRLILAGIIIHRRSTMESQAVSNCMPGVVGACAAFRTSCLHTALQKWYGWQHQSRSFFFSLPQVLEDSLSYEPDRLRGEISEVTLKIKLDATPISCRSKPIRGSFVADIWLCLPKQEINTTHHP